MTETGDDVDLLADDISVLICNHQSAIDVNLLFGLLVARRRGAERAMWTLSRMLRWTHIGMMAAIRGDFMLPKVDTSNGQVSTRYSATPFSLVLRWTNIPVNRKHLYNICTMLDQRRRRWAVVVHMLCKSFVFVGIGLGMMAALRAQGRCHAA